LAKRICGPEDAQDGGINILIWLARTVWPQPCSIEIMTQNTDLPTHEEGVKKLGELMKDIKFGMLATIHEKGALRSRPMTLLQVEPNGNLWFLTGKNSLVVSEIENDPRVNVAFSDTDGNTFVSISGFGRFPDDPAKLKEVWNPIFRTWFPGGLDDPNVALLKIDVECAEYWDSPHGAVRYLFGMLTALATGKAPSTLGDHQKLDLK